MIMEHICRICLRTSDKLLPLFQTPLLVFKIVAIASVEIFSNDNLPQTICEECSKNVDAFFIFKEIIISSDIELKKRYLHRQPKLEDLSEDIEHSTNYVPVLEAVPVLSKVEYEADSLEDKVTIEIHENEILPEENEVFYTDSTSNIKFYNEIDENADFNSGLESTEITESTVGNDGTVKEPPKDRKIKCNECGKLILNDKLDNHVRLYCVKPVNCEQCGETVKNKYFLEKHLAIVHDKKTYPCKVCGMTFGIHRYYQKHVNKHHATIGQQNTTNNSKNVNMRSCDICGVVIRASNLSKHIRLHYERPVECGQCGKVLKNNHCLKDHLLIHKNTSFTCKICGKSFAVKKNLSNHIKRHYSKSSEPNGESTKEPNKLDDRAECNICGKYVSADYLPRHIKLHNEKPVKCDECGKTSKNIHSFRDHMLIHQGTVYTCENCGKTFNVKRNLTSHMRNHCGTRSVTEETSKKSVESSASEPSTPEQSVSRGICNVCGKSISSYNLATHVRMHTENPVKCEKCGKTLKNTLSLRSHLLRHRNTTYICDVCGMSFVVKNNLTRHKKKHHGPGLPKVKCSICHKAFPSKSIKKHQQVHTGERPYSCSQCGKKVSSSYALKTHMYLHSDVKAFKCRYCPKDFYQKISLVMHLKSKHKDVDAELEINAIVSSLKNKTVPKEENKD